MTYTIFDYLLILALGVLPWLIVPGAIFLVFHRAQKKNPPQPEDSADKISSTDRSGERL